MCILNCTISHANSDIYSPVFNYMQKPKSLLPIFLLWNQLLLCRSQYTYNTMEAQTAHRKASAHQRLEEIMSLTEGWKETRVKQTSSSLDELGFGFQFGLAWFSLFLLVALAASWLAGWLTWLAACLFFLLESIEWLSGGFSPPRGKSCNKLPSQNCLPDEG